MSRKTVLHEGLRWAHAREEAFLSHETLQRSTAEGSWERWTCKDHLAHVAAWKKYTADLLGAPGGAADASFDVDIDRFNRDAFLRFSRSTIRSVIFPAVITG